MAEGLGRGILEILLALLSLALISMLVTRSQNVTQIVQSGASAFSTLLQAASMQSNNFMGGLG